MLYKLKGYSDDWIEKRMRSIAIREELRMSGRIVALMRKKIMAFSRLRFQKRLSV